MWGRHLLPPQRTPIRGGRREECRWGILKFSFKREHFTFLSRTYHWKKPFLFPEIPETATTKASCSQSTNFFCTFLVPQLGQTVKGKKYWITRLIFWQGQKFSRILISPIHLPLQSSKERQKVKMLFFNMITSNYPHLTQILCAHNIISEEERDTFKNYVH